MFSLSRSFTSSISFHRDFRKPSSKSYAEGKNERRSPSTKAKSESSVVEVMNRDADSYSCHLLKIFVEGKNPRRSVSSKAKCESRVGEVMNRDYSCSCHLLLSLRLLHAFSMALAMRKLQGAHSRQSLEPGFRDSVVNAYSI